MKGSLGRRVLLLAPLAPLLAAPASVLAVPSVEDKRNADREKVARHIRPALLKNSQDKVIYIVEFNQQRIADQKDDAKVAQIRENKPEMEFKIRRIHLSRNCGWHLRWHRIVDRTASINCCPMP